MDLQQIRVELLEVLVETGSLKISRSEDELFVLKSGRRSPFFVNLGTITDGRGLMRLRKILASYTAHLLRKGMIEDFEFVFGPAYKGIGLAILTCEGLAEHFGMNKRYLYDRKKEKERGDIASERTVVGAEHVRPGHRVLVMDDVVTSGETKAEALDKLKALGVSPVGIVVLMDRQERVDGATALEHLSRVLGVKAFAILDMKSAYNSIKGQLPNESRKLLKDYYGKYGAIALD